MLLKVVTMRKKDGVRDGRHGYQGIWTDKGEEVDVPVPTWNPGGP